MSGLSNAAFQYEGQVAIVTGAGSGLGRAYAKLLAARGARVVVNDIGMRKLADGSFASSAELTAQEIRDQGGQAIADTSSVATREGGQAIADLAMAQYGRIDILVNNAGNISLVSFNKLDLADADPIFDVHTRGAFYVTQPCYRQMVKQQYGRIIFTTSGVALFGNGGITPYAAAKGGVFGLLQVLKLEGAKHGIKVNAVAPMAATPLTEDAEMPQYHQVGEEMSVPELVAPVVGYFASRECAYTGETWSAGSGSVARLFVGRSPGLFKHPVTQGQLTIEDVADNTERIRSEKNYTTPESWPDEWALVVDLLTGRN
ncbi:MAG: SDR family NAD(P)-dependent oxidoreductase [Pseudoxanthomonas sp.]|jgi:NAD(P)-dependent dehydrogenase (short-subunit alcohol dehydrogenase family)|nr:SDR family NAD(P)-dependent oxidoreductase [Pseudoxanthomonas sp.]